MPDPLPRPVVDVTAGVNEAGQQKIDVVIHRDNKARSFHGTGATTSEAVSDVIGRVLGDHNSAEYIPKG